MACPVSSSSTDWTLYLEARRRFIATAKAREASGVPLDDRAAYFRGVLRELHAQRQLEERLSRFSPEEQKQIMDRVVTYNEEALRDMQPGGELTVPELRAPILRAAREFRKEREASQPT